MPSTAWNVLVASGVAAVVYLGVRMGQVLSAIAAGTILFVGGWMTGYAIEQDPPISIPRMLTAGGICGFVVVWTLLIRQGDYLIGGAVIGLVSFAAWLTSEMGPIKGDTGPTAPIDEPKPPEGRRPGTPVDLGGERAPPSPDDGSASSVLDGLRGLLSPSAADAPEPPDAGAPGADGPSPDEVREHPPADDAEGPTYATRRADPDGTADEKESIFGLGIFYEGDPAGPTPAGASTSAEPKDGDHTRPGAVDGRPSDERSDDGDDETDSGPIELEIDDERRTEPSGDDPAAEPAEASPVRRLREPLNSPRPPGKSPEVDSVDSRDRSEGDSSDAEPGTGDVAGDGGSQEDRRVDAEEGSNTDSGPESADDEEPPEEHRVEIDDDGDFVFG